MSALLYDNIQLIAIMQLAFLFSLFLYLVWYYRDIFGKILSGKIRYIIFLGIILLYFFFLNVFYGFSTKMFVPSDEEWVMLRLVREMMSGETIFHSELLRYGMVYPILLSGSFYLFKTVSDAAVFLNITLSFCVIILVYLISMVLFKNEKVSLSSTIIYIFSPLAFVFTGLQMGFPMVATVALLLSVLASLLLFEHHSFGFLLMSIIALLIASQVKPEYMVLIFPFLIYFFWRKEYRYFSFKVLLLCLLFFLFFSIPYLIKNQELQKQFSTFQCGIPSLYSDYGNPENLSIPGFYALDSFVRKDMNGQFAVSHIFRDFPNFIQFWTFRMNIIISLFILSAIAYLSYWRKRGYGYILLIFFFITILYLAHCAYYQQRYLFPSYVLISTLSGSGLYALCQVLAGRKRTIYLIGAILAIYAGIFCYTEFFPFLSKNKYNDNIFGIITAQTDYANLKYLLEGINPENARIIVLHPNEENILRAMGYKADSLVNILGENLGKINDNNVAKYLKLILRDDKENYFVTSLYCIFLPSNTTACNYILNNYQLKEVGAINVHNRIYRISE